MAYKFQISANLLSWPKSCTCCGNSADTHIRASASRTTGKRVKHTKTSWWEVPYCSGCLQHKQAFDAAGNWILAGLVLGIAIWFFVGFTPGILLTCASILPFSMAQSSAKRRMKKTCCSPSAAVRYLEWHGTIHTFVFESKLYLDNFLSNNSSKKRSDIKNV